MSPRTNSGADDRGCVPCSEKDTLNIIRAAVATMKTDVAVTKTNIDWITKTMKEIPQAKILERVTKLETHKKIVTWLITIFGPPITGGIGTIIYLIVKHMSHSGG